MSNLKMKVTWAEENLFPVDGEEDIVERSVVSDQYYPENLFFSEEFGVLASQLEEKFGTLDHGGDNVFYELDMADYENDGSGEDVACQILEEVVSFLDSKVNR